MLPSANTSHNQLSTQCHPTRTPPWDSCCSTLFCMHSQPAAAPGRAVPDKKSRDGADAKTVAKTYGRLQSFFQAAQTIGSPIVGALLDKIGARYCSVIVFLASASPRDPGLLDDVAHPVWKSTSAVPRILHCISRDGAAVMTTARHGAASRRWRGDRRDDSARTRRKI